jgi:hypothetical protein
MSAVSSSQVKDKLFQVGKHFDQWGGMERAKACFDDL